MMPRWHRLYSFLSLCWVTCGTADASLCRLVPSWVGVWMRFDLGIFISSMTVLHCTHALMHFKPTVSSVCVRLHAVYV